jgi:2-dehydropantoate 2-reductase
VNVTFAFVGAGGIGGYLGARLAAAGEDVVFIARGHHLEAMQREGLRLKSPEGDVRLERVRATNDPAGIGPVDVVVAGVKLWDLESAMRSALPLVGKGTTVVGFQNGVEKEAVLGRVAGADRVVGGIAYISTEIEAPGVILKKGTLERFILGELDTTKSARVERLCGALSKAGIKAELSTDITREIWEKFVFLACNAALTTLLRLPLGPIRENPHSRELLLDALREAVAVARAKQVALPQNFAEDRLAFMDGLGPETRASMSVDLERGNRLEVEWLSGAIARMGRELGVPTPVHRVVADALAPFANGRPGVSNATR